MVDRALSLPSCVDVLTKMRTIGEVNVNEIGRFRKPQCFYQVFIDLFRAVSVLVDFFVASSIHAV